MWPNQWIAATEVHSKGNLVEFFYSTATELSMVECSEIVDGSIDNGAESFKVQANAVKGLQWSVV